MVEKLDKKIVQIMDEGIQSSCTPAYVIGYHCGVFFAVEYEWMPKEPITNNSDFIRDILAYLESMFAALQLLPVGAM